MKTFSALLAICAGNSPVPGEFPTQRPVVRSFDVYFDLRPKKRFSKQSWGWWFETPSPPLWRHRNVLRVLNQYRGCWWLGAKAPNHQQPQCWLITNYPSWVSSCLMVNRSCNIWSNGFASSWSVICNDSSIRWAALSELFSHCHAAVQIWPSLSFSYLYAELFPGNINCVWLFPSLLNIEMKQVVEMLILGRKGLIYPTQEMVVDALSPCIPRASAAMLLALFRNIPASASKQLYIYIYNIAGSSFDRNYL